LYSSSFVFALFVLSTRVLEEIQGKTRVRVFSLRKTRKLGFGINPRGEKGALDLVVLVREED
jgi:hypothetical protein